MYGSEQGANFPELGSPDVWRLGAFLSQRGRRPDRDYSQVKRLHCHKILESDEIVVVSDKSLYYGESTTEEIAFAKHRNIPVFYFDGETFGGWERVEQIPDRYANTSLIDSFRLKLAAK